MAFSLWRNSTCETSFELLIFNISRSLEISASEGGSKRDVYERAFRAWKVQSSAERRENRELYSESSFQIDALTLGAQKPWARNSVTRVIKQLTQSFKRLLTEA